MAEPELSEGTMARKPFVVKPADRRTPLNVLGTQVTVLASSENSSDHRITVQTGSDGMGPPPHSHDWDESFYVSGGEVRFTCDGETTMCPAGSFVHVPAGTVHAFSYGPNGGELIEMTARGSNAIEMFSAFSREMPAGPPDVAKAVAVTGEHGVKLHI
jgi:quercetin dioxygenase-like cupin family protein